MAEDKKHSYGSFDYKIINKNIRDILDARARLDNTVQMAMPFVKATTTIKHPYLGKDGEDDNIGFTLGLHGINEDVLYKDMYSSEQSTDPLIGYTYNASDGSPKRLYAVNPAEKIQTAVNNIFDRQGTITTYPDDAFIRIPPPGITSVTIGRNKNGLLASAQLQITVPSLMQLESLHKVFLVPGMGMVLEWGQQFAVESLTTNVTGELPDITYQMFPWNDKKRLLPLLNRLAKREVGLNDILENYVYPTSGQYMWMFGRVANFSIQSNSDGSFNVTVKIVGPSEDAWAYSTTTTVVPRKDPSSDYFCATDVNSVHRYFSDTVVGGLNLKTLLDRVESGKDSRLRSWKAHVYKITAGNAEEKGDPKPDTPTPTVDQKSFANEDDAYFMTWRFFVNVVVNDPEVGIKAVFSRAGIDAEKLKTIGLLLPYAHGDNRENTNVATLPVIDDPKESFVGCNKYLRSIDPSVMVIVNDMAAELAKKNSEYNMLVKGDEFLSSTEESDKFKQIPGMRFELSAAPYITDSNNPDRGFLSTGVWLNHKAVCESMIGADTILRGVVNLLNRMSAATSGYWQLVLDQIEGDANLTNPHSYTVVDANRAESSDKAVSKFIENVHVFNKYIRTKSDGTLVGSELIESSIDLSLPKRLFSQIATLGLVSKEESQASGVTEDVTSQSSVKISDPNDTLSMLFGITSLSTKDATGQGPDLTILPVANQGKRVCGGSNLQTVAGAGGQGYQSGKSDLQDLAKQDDKTLERTYSGSLEKINSDVCKKCEQCGSTVQNITTTTSTTTPVPTTTGQVYPETTLKYIKDTPWSAGFISYIMKVSNVQFPAAGAHVGYAQAIRKGFTGWQALDPGKTKPQVGDVIVQNRSNNTLRYSSPAWSGFSHGDIVTDISANKLTAVGGNVAQTVKASVIKLSDGKLDSKKFFVILRPPTSAVNNITTSANIELNKWSENKWREETPAAFDSLNSYYMAGKLVKQNTLKPPQTTTVRQTQTPFGNVGANKPTTQASGQCKKLSELTVGEIRNVQKPNGNVLAVGKYQAIPVTFKAWLASTKVSPDTVFDKSLQESLGDWLIVGKRPKVGQFVNGGSVTIETAQLELAKEFASIPVPYTLVNDKGTTIQEGESYYKDRGGNKANHTTAEVRNALLAAKQSKNLLPIKQFIAKGEGGYDSLNRGVGGDTTTYSKQYFDALKSCNASQPPQTVPTPSEPAPSNQSNECKKILEETTSSGKTKCGECSQNRQVVEQVNKVNSVRKTAEQKLRQFSGLRKAFRYVEVFPEMMVASITGTADGTNSNAFGASPGSLSISGDMTLPGINGIRVGELFWIDRIPTFYKAFGAFQVMSIEDVIDSSGWKTKINARFNYLGNKWKDTMANKLAGIKK